MKKKLRILEKLLWISIIVTIVGSLLYINPQIDLSSLSTVFRRKQVFETDTITFYFPTKEGIENLCNVTLEEGEKVRIFDNNTLNPHPRNLPLPYTDEYYYCEKSDIEGYDFIFQLK